VSEKSSYYVRVICDNCWLGKWIGERITIPAGRRVANHPCPQCGCKTLRAT
jgi:hypothetical protein